MNSTQLDLIGEVDKPGISLIPTSHATQKVRDLYYGC